MRQNRFEITVSEVSSLAAMLHCSIISLDPKTVDGTLSAWPDIPEHPKPSVLKSPESLPEEPHPPSLVFLCCRAADGNAVSGCREIRLRAPDAGLIVLTPKPQTGDSVIQFLNSGADDCLPLPGSREEFHARLEAWERRWGSPPAADNRNIKEQWKAEKRLPDSEEHYRLLFESNPQPLMIYDLETLQFLAVNNATVQAYGYTREEFLNMTIKDIRPRDDVSALMENISSVRNRPAENIDHAGVWRHRLKGGRIIFVEITSHPLLFNKRKAELVLAYNVTERQRIESSLRKSEGRFASFMRNLPGVAFIKDRSGAYVFANVGWEKTFRRSFNTSRGKTDAELFPPEMANEFRQNDAKVLRDKKGMRVQESVHGENGTMHWLVAKFPISDGEDPAAMIGGVAIDVTREKEAEEALRRHERELRNAHELLSFHINNSPLAVVEWDRDFKISYWSPRAEQLFGWSADDVLGRHPDDWRFVHPNDAERVGAFIQSLLDNTTTDNFCQNRNFTRDGRIIYCEWYNSVRFDENGKMSSIFSLVDDVTDRVTAEQELAALNRDLEARVAERTARLEAVNQELESFSYSVSHDLRAPLRGIDGFSQALEEMPRIQTDETARGYLRRVRSAADRMGQLIDDLLQLSRLSRHELQRGEVDLSALATTILQDLQQSNPDRSVTVEVQPDIVVSADARLSRIMLENLLSNAWKFTAKSDDARITVDCLPDGRGTEIYRVHDNGVGFDMRYAHKLFGPFQRLHAMNEFPGTGIGLATVKRIVQLHGGRVRAEGIPNQGATFSFTLG